MEQTPLLTRKAQDYEVWKQAVLATLERKQHDREPYRRALREVRAYKEEASVR